MSALTFDEKEHRYFLDGVEIPSVTRITGQLNDFSRIAPDKLERARLRGTAVHLACELDDKGDLDESSVAPEIAPYLAAWRKFKSEAKATVFSEFIERRVVSEKYRYAGRLDRVMEIGTGAPSIVDIKTGDSVGAGPQLMAYLNAMEEMQLGYHLHGNMPRYVVRLRNDGTYRLTKLEDANGDWRAFLALLTIYNWRKK